MKLFGGKKDEPKFERRTISTEQDTTFQRSRTISSYQPTLPSELERTHVRALHAHRNRMLQILGGLAVLIAICTLLLLNFTSSTKFIYSDAPMTQPDVEGFVKSINDYYAQHPLERFSFLLDTRTLGASLASSHPEVSAIAGVESAGFGTTRFELTLRKPVARWQVGNQTTYVDQTGKAFKNDYFGGTTLVSVTDEGAAASGAGAVTSEAMIGFIGQIISRLSALGIGTVDRVVIPAQSLREVDLYLQGRGYRVKVQTDRDPDLQSQDVKAAVTYIDQHGGANEYVDVRVAGKAYYK